MSAAIIAGNLSRAPARIPVRAVRSREAVVDRRSMRYIRMTAAPQRLLRPDMIGEFSDGEDFGEAVRNFGQHPGVPFLPFHFQARKQRLSRDSPIHPGDDSPFGPAIRRISGLHSGAF